MNVLVTAASKYGSTAEIAEAVGSVLRDRGVRATVVSPEEVESVQDYDAVILGSAVYAGRWQPSARELVERVAHDLAARPVWLFSSGPVGDPPQPAEPPADSADLLERTGAREHRVFPGKVERSRLGFSDKAIVLALRVADGDYRDWAGIEGWASHIADSLSRGVSS